MIKEKYFKSRLIGNFTLLIFLVIVGITFGASLIITYPDKIVSRVKITYLSDTNEMDVEALMARHQLDKIESGLQVRLILDDFPAADHGSIRGGITLKRMSHENKLLLRIALKDGFTSTKKRTIPLTENMEGNLEVVKNRTIFDWLTYRPTKQDTKQVLF